ncbi:hypothetical protein ACTNEN_05555 [Oribacterium sp. HCP28S3_H8]|uniref:hypothetical protein n=1 Tax=Oribacterium sp. HCP28S3_H8 TaxID=3438945 RepID=UPI003F88661B
MLKNYEFDPDEIDLSKCSPEDIKAALGISQMLVRLESQFRRDLDPKTIIMKVLKLTCSFYGGDWAGVLDIDPEVGVWTAHWWYNVETDGMTPTNFNEFENVSEYVTWAKALDEERTLCIPMIDPMTEQEKIHYRRLGTKTVIAAPFYKGATGFVVVRNPTQYEINLDLLKLVAYVASCEYHDYRLIDSCKHQLRPEYIRNENDVYINLFGGLEIVTVNGVIRSEEINPLKIAPLIVFLSLHRNHAYSAFSIAQHIFPDDPDAAEDYANKIKYHIYTFRQNYSELFSAGELIETTKTGYRFSEKLHITIDTETFGHIYKVARNTSNLNDRVRLLEKAVDIYKNDIYPPASTDPWLMPTVMSYSKQYFSAIEDLLNLLDKRHDYSAIHDFAVAAMEHHTGNERLYYWMIVAMIERHQLNMAAKECKAARKHLFYEDQRKLEKEISERYPNYKLK